MSCHEKAIKTSEMYLTALIFSKFLDRLGLKLSLNCPNLALIYMFFEKCPNLILNILIRNFLSFHMIPSIKSQYAANYTFLLVNRPTNSEKSI